MGIGARARGAHGDEQDENTRGKTGVNSKGDEIPLKFRAVSHKWLEGPFRMFWGLEFS